MRGCRDKHGKTDFVNLNELKPVKEAKDSERFILMLVNTANAVAKFIKFLLPKDNLPVFFDASVSFKTTLLSFKTTLLAFKITLLAFKTTYLSFLQLY